MSAVAVLALGTVERGTAHARKGAGWLLERESRSYTAWQRFRMWLSRSNAAVEQDQNLLAWPWSAGTAAWVEPTAWSLLALKRLQPFLPERRVATRIRMGEAMLADRMCDGGGWNYGNRRVMGEDLTPFPDTTALALMALADRPSSAAVVTSLSRLDEMFRSNRSTLVTALYTISCELYGRNVATLRQDLQERLAARTAAGDIRTLALGLLALAPGAFRIEAAAA